MGKRRSFAFSAGFCWKRKPRRRKPDDSSFVRNLVIKILEERMLAEEVLAFENGMTFIAEFRRRLSEQKPVSLAILDLQMPVMDGLKAALTMRALEQKMNVTERTPIIFFSACKCDEALKKQLSRCAPAAYFNKGDDPDPASLADRTSRLVSFILSTQSPEDASA
jgi:CheY-like chemotaxis protein